MAKQYCRERAGLVRRRAKGLKHCTHPDNWTDNWTGNIISEEWNKAHTQTTGLMITGRVLICTHNINTGAAEKLYIREYTLGNLCKKWSYGVQTPLNVSFDLPMKQAIRRQLTLRLFWLQTQLLNLAEIPYIHITYILFIVQKNIDM